MSFRTTLTTIVLGLFAFCQQKNCWAQDSNRVNAFPIPVVFSSPETGFAFGASLFASSTLNKGSGQNRQSSAQVAAIYTTKNQLLLYVPFQIFLNKRGYLHEGELGYYRYNYPFYGVGNSAQKTDLENYEVRYPRLIYNVYRQWQDHLFFGFGFRGDVFSDLRFESNGILDAQDIQGKEGGRFYTFSSNFKSDKRNDVFFPTEGYFLTSSVEYAGLFGYSSYQGWGLRNDFNWYTSILQQSVFALNAGFEVYDADYPFYQKAFLGGTKRLRGLIAGRYRDNAAVYAQAEGRFFAFNKAYFTAFAGIGSVAERVGIINESSLRLAVGAGLRYQLFKQNKLNARVDFGYAEGDLQFYLTFGEAF